jgi:hypothetical protein
VNAAVFFILAAAIGGDYRPDSSDWNGLATVADAAAAAGCPVETRDSIDWSALNGTDVLWILYPRAKVDSDRLALFLEAGGRVLLGDDFGNADAALARLDIHRARGPVGAARYYQDNPSLPEADSSSESALSRAAPSIVTNHPAHFITKGPAAYRYSADAAAVIEGRLGRGHFVALADPSVLINDMQQIDEDRRFAGALIAATCRPHLDRILLITGDFSSSGDPPASLAGAPEGIRPPGSDARTAVNGGLADLNDLVPRLSDHPPDSGFLSAFAIAAVVLMVLVLGRGLPTRSPGYDGSWTRAPSLAAPQKAPLVSDTFRYTLPASLLRDEAISRVSEALGEPASVMSRDEIASRLQARFGDEAGHFARLLWAELARVRRNTTGRGSPAWLSQRRLARLHRLAVDLFAQIDPGRARVSG